MKCIECGKIYDESIFDSVSFCGTKCFEQWYERNKTPDLSDYNGLTGQNIKVKKKLFADLPLKERISLARVHVSRPDSDYL